MRVPRVYVPQTRPASPQGGYLQGGSLQVRNTVGESLQDIAQSLRVRQQKAESFDISKRLIEEANELQQDFDARTEAEPLGAAGFTERLDVAYAERHQAIIEDYRARGYSADSLRELDLRLASYRQSYNAKALAFQDESYRQLVNKETGDAVVQLSQYATANPNAIQSTLDELNNLLASRSGIEATDIQEMYDRYRAVLIESAGDGLALYNPQEVINLLAPEELITSDVVPTATGDFNLDTYMQATRSAESSGNDGATATTSTATGRYQFLKGTWLETYRQTYPESRETDAQILAKRKDGAVQDAVMKTFTLRNIQQLEAANVPVTNASVYLAHFLGVQSAIAAMTSPATASVSDFVSAEAIAANKAVFSKVKTVEDLLEFAEQKVGGNNPGAAASTTQVVSSRIVQPQVLRDSASPPPAPSVPLIPGNLPLEITNIVKNADGTVSTVQTISIGTDQGEVLIPTVINGRLVSESDAIAHYEETGEHFGVFKDAEEATAYAKWLHERHETNLAPTGNPVLDLMTGPQRLAVLQRARAEQARHQAENRAGVDVGLANEQAAYMTEGEYAGTPISDDEIRAAYPPAIAEQKIREQAEIRRIGPVVKEMKMMTPQQIAEQLELLRPKDTASPTYATELQAYNLAQRAAQQNLEAREKDPAAYVYQTFPNIARQLKAGNLKQGYAALEKAYDKLGTPANQRFALTEDMAEQEVARYKTLTVPDRIRMIQELDNSMSSTLFGATLDQLSKSGIGKEALLYQVLKSSRNYKALLSNVLAGKDIMAADSSRRPNIGKINEQYRAVMGTALANLNPEVSAVYRDSAMALYVQRGGDPKNINTSDFRDALHEVIGGIADDKSTGLVDMTSWGSDVDDKTLLPPGVTKKQFQGWIDTLTVETLRRFARGNQYPLDSNFKPVPIRDIVDDGVFVNVGPAQYIIKMQDGGGVLQDKTGRPQIIHIIPEMFRSRK
jgi:hypothetical protein